MSKPIINRHVTGPFGEIGYIAKKPGHGVVLQRALDEQAQRKTEERCRDAELNQMKLDERMKDFWKAADLHSLNARVDRFVDLGMQAYDNDLEHKKNKLKVLMLNEQSNLTQEYTDKAQKSAEQLFQSKKKRAEEIEKTAGDAEKTYVEEVYKRMFKENCDEVRSRVRKESRVALNDIHKEQICEKLLAEYLEKEEEKLWTVLAEEEDDRRKRRSELERASVDRLAREYVSALDQQKRDTELRKQNETCIDRLEEGWRKEILATKELEYNKREVEAKQREEQTSKDIVEQVEANRLIRKRQKEEEEYLDKLMIDADLEAYRAELAAIVDNRVQLRSELAIFKESLKQYKDAVEANARDLENANEAEKMKIENDRRKSQLKVAEAKRELLKNCVAVRKQQVAARKALEEKQKKEDREYLELLKLRLAQNEALDAAPRHPGQQMGKTAQYPFVQASKVNDEQRKYLGIVQQRKRQEVQEMVDNMKKEQEETDRKIQELLKSPLQVVAGSGVHPFLPHLLAAKK